MTPSYNEVKRRLDEAIPPQSPLRNDARNLELLVVGVLAGDIKVITFGNGEVRVAATADIWPPS